ARNRRGLVIRTLHVVAASGLLVFAAWTLTHFGGPRSHRVFDAWLYNALILLAVLGCALRIAWVKTERNAWIALTGALAGWALGEIFYDFVYGGAPPFPSVADVFYLAFYPACYVGLLLLIRGRHPRLSSSLWLDGAMASLAAAAVGAAVLFEAVLGSTHGSASAVITNLSYPIGDTLMLALGVGV